MNKVVWFLSTEREFPLTVVNDNKEPLLADVGEDFSYECRLLKPELQDQLVTFHWFKLIKDNTTGDYTLDNKWQRNNTGQFLHISNIQLEDSGQYACYVQNSDKQDYKIFDVQVQIPTTG